MQKTINIYDWDWKCPKCEDEDNFSISKTDYQVEYNVHDVGWLSVDHTCNSCGQLISVDFIMLGDCVRYDLPDPPPPTDGPDMEEQTVTNRMDTIKKFMGE